MADPFAELSAYCMFVGYPRSGHSLVGSLLNAHPEIVISHELDGLRFLSPTTTRRQLFDAIVRRDREFASTDRQWAGYDYRVPGGMQGSWTTLRVIGDKKGGGSSRQLARRPSLLDTLAAVVGLPIRLIHVVRNPWDIVATMTRRHRYLATRPTVLPRIVRLYETMAGAVATARRDNTERWFELRFESFVDSPSEHLSRLVAFLGVEPTQPWLDACTDVVRSPAHVSRHDVQWPTPIIDRLGVCIERCPWYGPHDRQPPDAGVV